MNKRFVLVDRFSFERLAFPPNAMFCNVTEIYMHDACILTVTTAVICFLIISSSKKSQGNLKIYDHRKLWRKQHISFSFLKLWPTFNVAVSWTLGRHLAGIGQRAVSRKGNPSTRKIFLSAKCFDTWASIQSFLVLSYI